MKKKILIIIGLVMVFSLYVGVNHNVAVELSEASRTHDVAKVQKLLQTPFAPIAVNTQSVRILGFDTGFIPKFPIQWAAMESQPEILKLLINAGADVNKRTEDSKRTIEYVLLEMDEKDRECVDILIENGADVNGSEFEGEPISLDAADQEPYTEEGGFDASLSQDSVEIYKKIVSVSSDRSKETIYDELSSAVRSNNFALVKYIIDNNEWLDMNYTGEIFDHSTRLLFFLSYDMRGDEETIKIAKLLIENGADKTLTDDEGETAYDAYIEYLLDGNIEKENQYQKELKTILKP